MEDTGLEGRASSPDKETADLWEATSKTTGENIVKLSSAISLKRIADALEKIEAHLRRRK